MEEIEGLRAEMDEVNARLVAVLQERARLATRIGAHKRAHGLPAVDADREAAMLSRALRDAPAGFAPETLEELLRTVFAASRALVIAEGTR